MMSHSICILLFSCVLGLYLAETLDLSVIVWDAELVCLHLGLRTCLMLIRTQDLFVLI